MRFIDEAEVQVSGGDGGSGKVGWRREKFMPRGGPDGGNGGDGGAVIFVAEPGLNTLIDFSFNPLIRAEPGEDGGSNDCDGADGNDTVRAVPVGTQVFFEDQLVADLHTAGARWIAARGGRGGKGNTFFKSATNQAPDYAQPGRQGERRTLRLVLKSVADVGLVGLPNVGKSTLVSAITASHPKIADYPFTTLRPSLGVVLLDEGSRFVMADIPGLIPGAHEGKGLGIQFLRHVERTSVLAHLLDASITADGKHFVEEPSDSELRSEVLAQFDSIANELSLFSPELAARSRLVVFSKADIGIARRAYELTKDELTQRGFESVVISSHTGEGLEELKRRLLSLVQEHHAALRALGG